MSKGKREPGRQIHAEASHASPTAEDAKAEVWQSVERMLKRYGITGASPGNLGKASVDWHRLGEKLSDFLYGPGSKGGGAMHAPLAAGSAALDALAEGNPDRASELAQELARHVDADAVAQTAIPLIQHSWYGVDADSIRAKIQQACARQATLAPAAQVNALQTLYMILAFLVFRTDHEGLQRFPLRPVSSVKSALEDSLAWHTAK